jgi:hypothetical protein
MMTARSEQPGRCFRWGSIGLVDPRSKEICATAVRNMARVERRAAPTGISDRIVLAFVAVFAAFGLGHTLVLISALMLVLGVFTGSGLWFLTLGYVATLFRKQLDSGGLRWVNRIAGLLIMISGVAAFVSVIWSSQQ